MGLCGSKEPASKYARRSHKHHHHGRHSHNRRKSVEYHARASLQQQHEAHPQHSSNQQGGPSSSDFARHSTPQQQNGFGNRPGSHLRGSVRGAAGEEDDFCSCRDDFSMDGSPAMSGASSPWRQQNSYRHSATPPGTLDPLNPQGNCGPGMLDTSQSCVQTGTFETVSEAEHLPPTDHNHPVMRGLVDCLPILHALNLNLGSRSSPGSSCSSMGDEDRPQAKPCASCSLQPLPPGADSADTFESWQEGAPYNVRGTDYLKTKVKVPGLPSLYKVAGADVFGFPCKRFDIAESVQVPQPSAKCIRAAKAAGLPPMIVFNIQLPIYAAPIFGPYDGDCISIISYTHLPEDFDAGKFPNQPALGLIRRLVNNGKEEDGSLTRDRLKLVPRVINIDEWVQKGPLSQAEHRLLTSYNEKPILTRPQHLFSSGENYLEIGFDVHQYTYLARKAISAYINRLRHVVWETAFIVQGNYPEELPEQVLASPRIYRMDFTKVRSYASHAAEAAEAQQKQPVSTASGLQEAVGMPDILSLSQGDAPAPGYEPPRATPLNLSKKQRN